jgi:hypothetical protein
MRFLPSFCFSSSFRLRVISPPETFEGMNDYSKLLCVTGKGDFPMSQTLHEPMPKLHGLPITLPRDGAVQLEFEQGVLIFRVSRAVADRIAALLNKHRTESLTPAETEELDQYEDIDDYLSFINRLLRNLALGQEESEKSV